MKFLILLSLIAMQSPSFALSLDDFQGQWTRFGVRCEGDTEMIRLDNPVAIKITGNTFLASSEWNDLGETTTTGEILTSAYPTRPDRLAVQFVNVIHKDIVTDTNVDQDFLYSKVGLKTLTLRVKQVANSDILILGGDDPKQMAKGCTTATEFLYRRVKPDQATNQNAN